MSRPKSNNKHKKDDDLDSVLLHIASLGTGAIIGLVVMNNLPRFRGFATPLIDEPYPSQIKKTYNPPESQVITPEPYPSQIKKTYNPPEEAQKKKEGEKKHTKKPEEVHTQIECPDDLSTLSCGANCYKDGKLWKIVCSEKEREALYTKKKTSITVPPNFPDAVTVTPGEEPSPSPPSYTPPPSENEYPESGEPEYTPTPQPQSPPTYTPPTTPTTPLPSGIKVYRPGSPGYPFKPMDCHVGNLSQDQKRETCRMNGDVDPLVGDNDYAIDCDVTLGNRSTDSEWPKDNPRVEITSAGPGSHDGLCCGFTVSVNIKDGTLHMESEDWSHASGKEGHSTGTTFCDDSKSGKKCSSVGSISGGQQLFGKTIHIHWDVRRDGSGNLYYTGEATGPGNKKVSKTIMNPTSPGTGGKPIIPGHGIGGYFSNSFILSSLGFVSRVQQTTA